MLRERFQNSHLLLIYVIEKKKKLTSWWPSRTKKALRWKLNPEILAIATNNLEILPLRCYHLVNFLLSSWFCKLLHKILSIFSSSPPLTFIIFQIFSQLNNHYYIIRHRFSATLWHFIVIVSYCMDPRKTWHLITVYKYVLPLVRCHWWWRKGEKHVMLSNHIDSKQDNDSSSESNIF